MRVSRKRLCRSVRNAPFRAPRPAPSVSRCGPCGSACLSIVFGGQNACFGAPGLSPRPPAVPRHSESCWLTLTDPLSKPSSPAPPHFGHDALLLCCGCGPSTCERVGACHLIWGLTEQRMDEASTVTIGQVDDARLRSMRSYLHLSPASVPPHFCCNTGWRAGDRRSLLGRNRQYIDFSCYQERVCTPSPASHTTHPAAAAIGSVPPICAC